MLHSTLVVLLGNYGRVVGSSCLRHRSYCRRRTRDAAVTVTVTVRMCLSVWPTVLNSDMNDTVLSKC